MSNLITKKSSLEEDTAFLQALLKKLFISDCNFKRIAVRDQPHGQQCGLRMRGESHLKIYKKYKKKYNCNYEKANKKYLHGAYPLVVGVIKELGHMTEEN